MDVLIGCEESQRVMLEFRKLGCEAFSNDIIDCSGGYPEYHLKMDVFEAIYLKAWDMIILHPPCTHLAISGNRWYGKNTAGYQKRIEAVSFTQQLWDYARYNCEHVAMENPVGVLNSMGNFPKPQYIQPWQFGHGETKKTGLWLYNLPELKPTKVVDERENKVWKMPPQLENRQVLRSKTYVGIAKAIAEQWVDYWNNL